LSFSHTTFSSVVNNGLWRHAGMRLMKNNEKRLPGGAGDFRDVLE